VAAAAGRAGEVRLITIDTNLLLYAVDRRVPEHAAARFALEKAGAGGNWGFTLVSAVEFWSWATRPMGEGAVASGEEALAFLAALLGAGAQLLHPLPGFGLRLLDSAQRHKVIGKRIFDWQIGLIALEHGTTEFWTHDRMFRAPPGLRLVDPLA